MSHEACSWYAVGKASAWEDATKWLLSLAGEMFVMGRDEEASLLRDLSKKAAENGKAARREQGEMKMAERAAEAQP